MPKERQGSDNWAREISKDKTNLQAATFDTNSGKRLLKVGDLEGAISQFRAAINLAPTYAPAHFHLGGSVADEKVRRRNRNRNFSARRNSIRS